LHGVWLNKECALTVVVSSEVVRSANGDVLQATFYEPQRITQGKVLIASALGVSQAYYAAFAHWLAEHGFLVVTFDYVGMGKSLVGRLQDVRTDVLTWGRNDCAAMIDVLSARAPNQPLFWIGHSLGGQLLGLTPNHAKVSKALTVACGSGFWRDNSPPLKRRVWFMWYFVEPLTTPVFGYFPGKRLSMVADLPRGVIRQWRRWCLHPNYAIGVEGESIRQQYAAIKTPMVSLSFTDDEFMSAKNTDSIHSFYENAPKQMVRLSPNDINGQRVGHFGFFRSQFQNNLWPTYVLPALQSELSNNVA
jgi:predicted alpha/beta hydrolase